MSAATKKSASKPAGKTAGKVGGALGGRLAGRIPPTLLRWIVVGIGVVVALIYLFRR